MMKITFWFGAAILLCCFASQGRAGADTLSSTAGSLAEEGIEVSVSPPLLDTARTDTVDGVLFSASAGKSRFRPGEPVQVHYRLKNNSMGTVSYDFPNTCQFDLQITDSKGASLYSLLAAGRCTPGATRITLPPGTVKEIDLAASLDLQKTDTLLVKPMMAGFPLSGVPLKILYVADPAPARPSALEGSNSSKPAIAFNDATKTLTIMLSQPQRLSITAFLLTGKQVKKLSTQKFLTAGTHRINLNDQRLGNGIVIFKVEGPGFSETRTINLAH